MKKIMTFNIYIRRDEISTLQSDLNLIKILPFDGEVKSELFTGKILPGACDVQITNAAGIRHMCARYMFEGTDSEGNACKLFVDNNGYFEPNSTPAPFVAYPVFYSDSKVLLKYLQSAHFRAEGHGRPYGVDIMIFDMLEE